MPTETPEKRRVLAALDLVTVHRDRLIMMFPTPDLSMTRPITFWKKAPWPLSATKPAFAGNKLETASVNFVL